MYPVNVRHASGGAKSFAAAATMPHVVGERGHRAEEVSAGAAGGHSDMVRIIIKKEKEVACFWLAWHGGCLEPQIHNSQLL